MLSQLLQAKPTNFCSFIDNVIPDDAKDYQNKSFREKVRLKPHITFCYDYPADSDRYLSETQMLRLLQCKCASSALFLCTQGLRQHITSA